MKGVNQPSDHFQDFLQDACEFLEDTLAKEKLSRTAMEHRTRLMAKISSLMKDQLRPSSVDMYIDMNSHPTLRAFFTSDSSTSGTDTSSVQGRNGNEEIYDEAAHLDEPDGGQAIYNEAAEEPQELAAPEAPPPPPPIKSNKTFLSMFMKTMGRNKLPKPPPKQDDAIYDDAAVSSDPVYDDASAIKSVDQPEIFYDDVNCTQQELYDDIRSCPESENVAEAPRNDADAMSIKSGLSESSVISSGTVGQGGITWTMSAKEAQAQALMSGIVKRRDCRKLLSAWRSSYAILLPSQLLFYSAEADGKPKAVLDLAPDIRVRRSVSSKQQAGDAKRVKMQPFLIDLDGKALYEISTKSRLETEAWITAIQSATTSPVPDVIPSRQQHVEETDDGRSADENTDADEDEDNIYEDLENFQSVRQQPEEEAPVIRNSKIRSRLSFFKFKRSSTQSEGSLSKRQSVNSNFNEEDIYHDPMTPNDSKNATPYDSVESLEQNKETAEVYNCLERQTVEAPAGFEELLKNMKGALKNVSSGHSDTLIKNPEEPSPPAAVYDTPSPTLRPLSPNNEINSFANLILQNQAKVLRRLSDSQNGGIQHYDVPTSNQKIVEPPVEELATYDHVVSPPRAVKATPITVETPKAKKMAQFWQEKVSIQMDKSKTPAKPSQVKETPTIKETQSVGRSFGRGPQRMPLSAVPENSEKPASVAEVIASFKSAHLSNKQSIPLSNISPNKKDPPPRPPAPLLPKGAQTAPSTALEETKPANDKLHTARWAYVAQNPLELSLNKGEVVQVMNSAGPSWFVRSTRNNKKGLVPREYLVVN